MNVCYAVTGTVTLSDACLAERLAASGLSRDWLAVVASELAKTAEEAARLAAQMAVLDRHSALLAFSAADWQAWARVYEDVVAPPDASAAAGCGDHGGSAAQT
jgi:hypothetical protein